MNKNIVEAIHSQHSRVIDAILLIGNYTGNVGKTTLSKYLFEPRMLNVDVVSIETINSNGSNGENVSGDEFSQIINAAFQKTSSILDVGASNIEMLLNKMSEFDGSENFIDYYIVPVFYKKKHIEDTISFINELFDRGIPKEKIIVIFNMVSKKDNIKQKFSELFLESDKAIIDERFCIYETELFSRLNEYNDDRNIIEIATESVDYKKLIRAETDPTKRLELTKKLGTQALALGVMRNMDNVFNLIFPETSEE